MESTTTSSAAYPTGTSRPRGGLVSIVALGVVAAILASAGTASATPLSLIDAKSDLRMGVIGRDLREVTTPSAGSPFGDESIANSQHWIQGVASAATTFGSDPSADVQASQGFAQE